MNERISQLRTYIFDRHHHDVRRSSVDAGIADMASQMQQQGLSYQLRAAKRLQMMLQAERPVILPGEKIVVTRTIKDIPSFYTPEEWKDIEDHHYLHEHGDVCNISADYDAMLRMGLGAKRAEIEKRMTDGSLTAVQKEFLQSELICVEAIQSFVKRYAQYALQQGETATSVVLQAIVSDAPTTLREALQLLRIMHFCLWEAGHYHNTLGRFDQYIYPYYQHDISTGYLNDDDAFDLIEEFFLMCNKDSDLYPGMQQGDNGQSIVLGGRSADGTYLFNNVSRMCLRASYELELIDPKINIRVDKDTPEEIFTLGSELTKIGLGFPQYSNDDVVIPALERWGYEPEDARNYVVAACWEFILPGVAMDIPNINAVPLAACVKACLPRLAEYAIYDDLFAAVKAEINRRADELCESEKNLYMVPAPMMSLMMDGTIENAKDISLGSKYNNYAFHGTGVATAVDSLAAIKQHYYDQRDVDAQTLINAVNGDFAGNEELQHELRVDTPKMGQDVDWVDEIATNLLDAFDECLQGRKNERGGIWRAGTGTAMYYIWHATNLGATPDGRMSSEMIPANYSPSLYLSEQGPLSVVKSFAKPHLERVCNGGPLTLEFDSSMFRNDEATQKLGQLVRTFILLGGHQLQLNTINLETLLDAKKHPERHRNLIVRVWGWSGYFVELDECYQDHVINRIRFKN